MILKVATKVAVACALAALSIACSDGYSSYASGGASGSGGSAPEDVPSMPGSTEPMLVEVDTGKTMAAAPGDGVGVFVEYAPGGKWHVWWTCDTNQTGKSCAFNVKIGVESGTIGSSRSEAFVSGDVLSTPTPQRIEATTTTTTRVSGVWLETAPGAAIRLEASVSGVQESGFLFFVQNGKVNGGFPGRLTNPLLLRGTTP